MDDSAIILIVFVSAIGLGIVLWIYYAIIRAATDAPEQTRLLKVQVKLLGNLLVKQGMDIHEVNAMINPEYKKPEVKKESVPV